MLIRRTRNVSRHVLVCCQASGVQFKIKAPADRSVMVNNANIIESDVKCSNGTIHAKDQVLLTE